MLQFQIVYFWMALLQATAATQAPADLFEMRVRPVLAANCYACHREARMGGLRLDSRTELMKGGASGPAIVAGKSEESLMMRAVRRTHERFKMPPPPQQALKPEEIATLYEATRTTLREWIDRLKTETGLKFPEKVTAFRKEMGVHGRYGQPCPVCGDPIQRIRYAENETNYCATCQTGGRLLADRGLSRLLKEDWPRSLDEMDELKTR